MITHIEIGGFKSLEKVSLDLGGLNIFIGTNASGKSNFFDALRVLQGIGYGLTVREIFDGKPKGAGNKAWDGIRGGLANAAFQNPALSIPPDPAYLQFQVHLTSPELHQGVEYTIDIEPRRERIAKEWLKQGDGPIMPFRANGRPRVGEVAGAMSRLLSDTQLLDPLPATLRGYSALTAVGRLGDRGENLAGVVAAISSDEETRAAYTSWLKQLTPNEFDEVAQLQDALHGLLFAVKKGHRAIPAHLLSDGTLRFAALAAAFFQPDMPQTLLIEEIENGIHPTRLRLLLELLKSRTSTGLPQVFATSHSPLVLEWLSEEDYKTTFYCKKDDETGATTITPLSEIPRFKELTRKQPAAELFAEGWLETAL